MITRPRKHAPSRINCSIRLRHALFDELSVYSSCKWRPKIETPPPRLVSIVWALLPAIDFAIRFLSPCATRPASRMHARGGVRARRIRDTRTQWFRPHTRAHAIIKLDSHRTTSIVYRLAIPAGHNRYILPRNKGNLVTPSSRMPFSPKITRSRQGIQKLTEIRSRYRSYSIRGTSSLIRKNAKNLTRRVRHGKYFLLVLGTRFFSNTR